MGRAPCCQKMGLKKGPWTPEEDLILINYINTYGHNNWRALPKLAGLLRCGKSCRLRWLNYLRPDVKRGNFTMEEEDTIIKLHEMLGSRWSAIAARLAGRTDNEIKNVWHTHLKKRLPRDEKSQDRKPSPKQKHHVLDTKNSEQDTKQEQEPVNAHIHRHHHQHVIKIESTEERPPSPPQCSSGDMSTLTTSSSSFITSTTNNHDMSMNNFSVESVNDEGNLALDEDFWSEVLSSDTYETKNFQAIGGDLKYQFPFPSLVIGEEGVHIGSSTSVCDGVDFWYDVYTKAEELPQL